MKIINFRHGGNAGDTIYSLPSIKYICEKNNAKAILYLNLNVPSGFTESQHPLGNVMLNQTMYDMLYPLLKQQDYIQDVQIYDEKLVNNIDYDLDLFRSECKNLGAGNISMWYSLAYPELTPNLQMPSIALPPLNNDYILVNRTSRYNNYFIDYSILKNYDNVYFVGVESEFKALQIHNQNIKHYKVNDFLELAQLIAGCKLFIGNQSMAFAIAEQLKVKRILEQYILAPNVIPQGGEYFIFHTNEQFKKVLSLCNG